MTKEEFLKRMYALRTEEIAINSKKTSLKREYVQSFGLKKGTEVVIEGVGKCWIRDITASDYGAIHVSVHLPKKNGQPSLAYRCLWGMNILDIQKVDKSTSD